MAEKGRKPSIAGDPPPVSGRDPAWPTADAKISHAPPTIPTTGRLAIDRSILRVYPPAPELSEPPGLPHSAKPLVIRDLRLFDGGPGSELTQRTVMIEGTIVPQEIRFARSGPAVRVWR
jgi:hypothetical protein